MLHHEQDAEDAFQATFLVLARSASSIRKRDALANWLHGVALRTALKARRDITTRRRAEQQASVPSQQEPVLWRLDTQWEDRSEGNNRMGSALRDASCVQTCSRPAAAGRPELLEPGGTCIPASPAGRRPGSPLADEVENKDSPNRVKAAVEILRLAQLPAGWHQIGPAEAEEIVRQIVKARRAQTPGLSDTLAEDGKGLPPFEQHMADTWRNERWNRKKRPPAPKWRERARASFLEECSKASARDCR